MIQTKTPPHCIESEQAVLGCLLIDWTPLEKLVGWIAIEDFYHPHHRKIFEVILSLVLKDEPIDVFTVASHFDDFPYLVKLADAVITTQRIMAYANIVKEKSTLRQLLEISRSIQENAHEEGIDAEELIEYALLNVQKIQQEKNIHTGDFELIKPIIEREIERIKNPNGDGDNLLGFATGFKDLDKLISGLYPGDFVILAGRPSMGKTALSVNLAESIALKYSKDVGVFSMEMDKTQIARRLISSTGKVNYQDLNQGKMGDNKWTQIAHSLTTLCDLKMHVDESGSLSINDIVSRARKLSRDCKGNLGLIVIDYIQLASGSKIKRYENRAQEVSDISKQLKALAKELKIPIIALSQLNRGLENRDDKRPMMSDLRESGALEQDADLIMFIYRDEIYYPKSKHKGMAEIIIGKQRNGPIGTIYLNFKGEYSSFENCAQKVKKPAEELPIENENEEKENKFATLID